MKGPARCFHLGSDARVREALARVIDVVGDDPAGAREGDLIAIESWACGAGIPGGNCFSACMALKRRAGLWVFVVVEEGDDAGRQLARFAMADGVLEFDGKGELRGTEAMLRPEVHGAPTRVDALLERFEGALSRGDHRALSALERLARWEREDSLAAKLQDPETGLFDGPFAAFKLDEECKRALRFHLPLTLVLLDIGADPLPDEPTERRALLAEVASVFLNESRDIDVLARFTETVFLFLLPMTPPAGAAVMARRMLANLAGRAFGDSVRLDPRAGLASLPAAGVRDRRALLTIAEACLDGARRGLGEGGLSDRWE
ncbi:MAG: hypothetical protein Fur0037_10570 [Planctomycetota bacterium]